MFYMITQQLFTKHNSKSNVLDAEDSMRSSQKSIKES